VPTAPALGLTNLDELRAAAATCTNCELYRDATQTVFGEGPADAAVVFVGEQPGDKEDLAGEPFVGPAGKLLDRAMAEAGIDRRRVYVTNAVKHFHFEPRGKRRIHKTPSAEHIRACRPWLDGEVAAIDPTVIVALGATAAKALLGPVFKVSQQRGEVFDRGGRRFTATVHPSSILRGPDEQRAVAYDALVDDLRTVAALLEGE
jgi:DNA polymerase